MPSIKVYNMKAEEYSNESVLVAHAKIVEEHENKVSSGQNIVLSQLGINPNDDKGLSRRQRIFKLIVSCAFILFVFAVFNVVCSILAGCSCFLGYIVYQVMYVKYVTAGKYTVNIGL